MITTRVSITKLASYINGNVEVTLYTDGTKVRQYEGKPKPEHPESIDLKITNWCDGGCAHCHESSTIRGTHCSVESVARLIEGLPPGVEIAIGGGDPLTHPAIWHILRNLTMQGLVANATVNSKHVKRHLTTIKKARELGFLWGLGLSWSPREFLSVQKVVDERTIVHFIVGVDDPVDARVVMEVCPRVLILGYKYYGRGTTAPQAAIEQNIGAWKYWLDSLMRKGTVCFDNLALEQLRVQERLSKDLWSKVYMGADGQFTMFADACAGECARSSTSKRVKWEGSAREYFRGLKQEFEARS